jgi:hypothetical protein
MRKVDRDLIQRRYRDEHGKPQFSPQTLERLWHEYKNPASVVRQLDVARLPADALTFYRPFHFSPQNEWGIYILVEPRLHHCRLGGQGSTKRTFSRTQPKTNKNHSLKWLSTNPPPIGGSCNPRYNEGRLSDPL